jgi:hypothetical protein
MTDALATFQVDDAAKQLRERIKLAFVEMFTDEQWEHLVKQEFAAFCKRREVPDGYSRTKMAPSMLSELCQEAMTELAKEKIIEAIRGDGCNGFASYIDGVVTGKLREHIQAHREELLDAMLQSLFGQAINTALNAVADAAQSHKTQHGGPY